MSNRFATRGFVCLMTMVLLTASGNAAEGPGEDGMNCTGIPWIPPHVCEEWKVFNENAERKWWVRFSDGGVVRHVFEHKGTSEPGIDLRTINRVSAHSEKATAALVEAYAKKRIRALSSVLGVDDPSLEDLVFADFRRENGETFPHIDGFDGTNVLMTERSSLPVYHLSLRQVVHGFQVENAGIDVVVDEENHLRSIWSTYRVEKPDPPFRARTSREEAIALAAAAIDVGELEREPGAMVVWVPFQGRLRLTWQVNFVAAEGDSPSAGDSLVVTVFDDSGEVARVQNLGLGYGPATAGLHCPRVIGDPLTLGAVLSGHRDGVGVAFDAHPPMIYFDPAPSPFSVATHVAAVETVTLEDLCVYGGALAPFLNGQLWGREILIDQAISGSHAQQQDYDFRPDDLARAVARYDLNSFGDPFACSRMDADTPSCAFAGHESVGFPDDDPGLVNERLLDGAMAYKHATDAADFFKNRFGHGLTREFNGGGSGLNVRVNSNYHGGKDAAYRCSLDTDLGTILTQVIDFDCLITLGRGDELLALEDNYTTADGDIVDAYVVQDMARDATMVTHEFTHAITADVNRIVRTEHAGTIVDQLFGSEGQTAPFSEGIADYFAATIHDQPAFAEWILRERDNRDCPTSFHQGGRNIATDPPFMVPYSLVGEEHDDGRAIAGPLWFLRTRMDDLGQQFFGGAATFTGRADRIAWGTIQRLGYNILHLDEVLSKALDTDKDAFDKLFHYEILAAFARHGIKTDAQIAVIQPSTFVVDGRTVTATGVYLPLEARAYLGSGTGYIAEFTTNPATFTSAGHTNEFQQPDPALPGFNFIRMTSSGGGPPVQPARYLADAGGCAFAADATDGRNNFVDLSLSHDQLESLLAAMSEQVAPIYMRIASLGGEAVDSRIPDAGGLIAGSNEVGVLYISEVVPPGCQCSAPGGANFGGGTVLSILGAVLLVVRRRHAS